MALKIETYEIDSPGTVEVKHKLGTLYPLVTVWQNGLIVTPSISSVDESTLVVYNLVGKAVITVAANVPVKSKAKNGGAK